MDQVDAILRELADDPGEYERQGGSLLLSRQGREYSLILKETPGVGIVVEGESDLGRIQASPLSIFVQRTLLDLPRLASQIVRTIDKVFTNRPAKYVDGPAELHVGSTGTAWQDTAHQFRDYLNEQELGTTRLVQLMAGAGQGKTVLLEQLARNTAASYMPDPFPPPFLLTVDLLGRYVGTVDDAIAGSLNNTYMFPGLTQRDVALCVRNRWIILALDGFDELVARIGARDAFQRVTELLDQLKGSGTVILSAREAFFELYQISAAIRSYLQPRVGAYNTSVIRLLPWTEAQGEQVFRLLGSSNPHKDLTELLGAFGNDRDIVLQPFFLTRLASLWQRGERFTGGHGQRDPRWRTEYIIQTYIDRETNLKWTARENGLPLLETVGHTAVLAGLAEEMWRSGAFRLSAEEVRLATEIALIPLNLPPVVIEEVIERAPTHAALTPRDRGYSFVHDRFFHYYLAVRLRDSLVSGDQDIAIKLLEPRELPPESTLWLDWLLRDHHLDKERALLHTLAISRSRTSMKVLEANLAQLLGVLLPGYEQPCKIEALTFVGDILRGREYSAVVFQRCDFWQLDVTSSKFKNCSFRECRFGEMLITANTQFSGSSFTDCIVQAVELDSERMLYEPDQIRRILEERGATVERGQEVAARQAFGARVRQDAVDAVTKLVRRSQKAYDVSLDEIEEYFSDARKLVRAGLESGVLRQQEKATSGPKKEFFRFQVDRQVLLRGQVEPTGDNRIDSFWTILARYFPRKAWEREQG